MANNPFCYIDPTVPYRVDVLAINPGAEWPIWVWLVVKSANEEVVASGTARTKTTALGDGLDAMNKRLAQDIISRGK